MTGSAQIDGVEGPMVYLVGKLQEAEIKASRAGHVQMKLLLLREKNLRRRNIRYRKQLKRLRRQRKKLGKLRRILRRH